jgi:hypothetical protein
MIDVTQDLHSLTTFKRNSSGLMKRMKKTGAGGPDHQDHLNSEGWHVQALLGRGPILRIK